MAEGVPGGGFVEPACGGGGADRALVDGFVNVVLAALAGGGRHFVGARSGSSIARTTPPGRFFPSAAADLIEVRAQVRQNVEWKRGSTWGATSMALRRSRKSFASCPCRIAANAS